MSEDRSQTGATIAAAILSWVMILVAAAGLILAYLMHPGNRVRNELWKAGLGVLGLIAAFGASGVGVFIAGAGLVLARRQQVRYRPLTAALIVNAVLLAGFVLLILLTRP